MSSADRFIGRPLSRVDGPLKVTGRARYAGEFQPALLLYGSVVNARIASGRITSIDSREAERLPGVMLVLTHENRPPMAGDDPSYEDDDAAEGRPLRPLFDDQILYNGQPVALVVAETEEIARHAASLLRIEYAAQPYQTDLLASLHRATPAPTELPEDRGDGTRAFEQADVRLDLEYTTPVEHHNPMEPHASTVHYLPDDSLEVYDKTQGVQNCMQYLENVLNMEGRIRVLSPFVGGAFGSGLRPQYQLLLAAMAALKLKRSVRVTLKRQQMLTFGYRPRTLQRLRLGATKEGVLQSIQHLAVGQTSRFENFTEHEVEWSGMLYQCPNVSFSYQLVPLDVHTPLDMRAPGATIGVHALECAMDELAYAAGIDPLTLRLKNYAERNQNEDKPWSSKALRDCYEQGAERFGWSRRPPQPRSLKQGSVLTGLGMATGVWEAIQMPASASARLESDGRLVVQSATADMGTGTYTVMTQIAAEVMGLALDRVEFRLGDSSFAKAPLSGGSATVSSVGSAVRQACLDLRRRLLDVAQQAVDSPFTAASPEDVEFIDGTMHLRDRPAARVELSDLLAVTGPLEVTASIEPGARREGYATATHSAVFAEVEVDEALGTVSVRRIVSAIAAGRVINPRTATNQIVGGVVWGIGMALQEETRMDHGLGRFMNHNLSEYHIPVQADIHDIEVIFVDEPDDIVNDLGSKGVGEIGIVGVAAAIANAIYHATGRRVRDLPVTLDKLL
jgi:xanthine dehydrogenase YagR molybdenum-binding subunit